jgi:hypothetical protein
VNRIQRVRRLRLASLAMTLGALLTVSGLPLAATTLAASGDTISISAPSGNVGASGAAFTVHVITNNATTDISGAQASVTFDPAALQITSVVKGNGAAWAGSVYTPAQPLSAAGIATANGSGDLFDQSAAFIGSSITHGGGNQDLFDITFSVATCPAGGSTVIGLPANGPTPGIDGLFLSADGLSSFPAVTTGATISCTPLAATDFTVGASPAALSIAQGGTDHSTISTTFTGTSQVITLASSGAPVGVGAAFGAATITGAGSTALTFTVGAAVPTGVYPITVTGTAASGGPHSTIVSLTVTLPAAGPPASTGQVTVTGTVDGGFLGLSVPANASLFLNRNVTNTTNVPVLVFSNTQWTLSIADAMLGSKAAADRGHMLDTSVSPAHRLAAPMQAYVPSPPAVIPVPGLLIRTLDVAGAQSLWGGSNSTTLPVTLSQLTQPTDPPGSYAIDVIFSAISGF